MNSTSLVTVSRELSSLKANLVRTRLEADGIECFLAGETLASVVGSPSSMGNEIWVQVRPEDADEARRILDELEKPAPADSDEYLVRKKPNLAVQMVRGLLIGSAIWCATIWSLGITGDATVAAGAGVVVAGVFAVIGIKQLLRTKH